MSESMCAFEELDAAQQEALVQCMLAANVLRNYLEPLREELHYQLTSWFADVHNLNRSLVRGAMMQVVRELSERDWTWITQKIGKQVKGDLKIGYAEILVKVEAKEVPPQAGG